MIPFDFEYHRPDTLGEAVETFTRLAAAGRSPLYYGGGTEILTLGRRGQLKTGAVVDLKAIPECAALGREDDELVFGAGRTLEEVGAEGGWPFLRDAAGRVADHTSRCRITFGGNLAATIPYREAALPLLLTASEAVVAGPGGVRRLPFGRVFHHHLLLAPGELLVQVRLPVREAHLPHFCVKRTRQDWVDYPLVTVAGLRRGGTVQAAFSGLCADPFRSAAMEEALGADGSAAERAAAAVAAIPAPVVTDLHGSADYRRLVVRLTLEDMLGALA